MTTKLALWLTGSAGAENMTELTKVSVESWMPLWLLPFLVAAIFLLCFFAYRRERTLNMAQYIVLSTLRSFAYSALLLALAMPRLEVEGEGVPPGVVPLVIDGTQSMQIADEGAGPASRSDAAAAIASKLLQGSSKGEADVKPYWAGKEFRQWSPTEKFAADCDYTSLAAMLQGAASSHVGEYCPGIILLSDGANNSGEPVEPVLKQLKARGVPVYCVGLGKERAKDIGVTFIAGDDVVFVNEKAKAFVNIVQRGYKGQSVKLRLLLEDKEVYSGEHVLENEGQNGVPVEYKTVEKGVFKLRAELEPLPGEITLENNSFTRSVRVIDERIRALLVFGSPSWEYRYLAGAFGRDRRVEYKSYLADADSRRFRDKEESAKLIRRLPETKESLSKDFDVVFLSRIDATQLPVKFLDALAGFVEVSGGGLAILSDPSGIPYTLKGSKLESLVPVTISRPEGRSYRDELFNPLKEEMRFDLTDDGLANQLVLFSGDKDENRKIWSSMPPVYECYSSGRLKPSAVSLLVTFQNRNRQSYPAIVHHSYGRGGVLFMGFDSTWRWRREFGDRYFRDFWGKAVQFLGLPHLLNEAAQSVIYVGSGSCYAGEKLDIRARVCNADFSPFRSERLSLSVKEGGLKREIDMVPIPGREGMYRADCLPEIPGEMELSLHPKFSAKPVDLRVLKQRKEFAEPAMNMELLERVAKETGGAFFSSEESGSLFRALLANRPKSQMAAGVSLWDSMLALFLATLLLGAEWVCRKLYCLD